MNGCASFLGLGGGQYRSVYGACCSQTLGPHLNKHVSWTEHSMLPGHAISMACVVFFRALI